MDERLREEEPSFEFVRPPGIQTFEAWGRLTVKDGKHKGKAYKVIYAADVNYKNYMKRATTLTSAWALSFQHYCRARDVEAAQKEKELPTERELTPEERARDLWGVLDWEKIYAEERAKEVATGSDGKRQLEGSSRVISMESSTEQTKHIQELQTKIALLQRELRAAPNGEEAPPTVPVDVYDVTSDLLRSSRALEEEFAHLAQFVDVIREQASRDPRQKLDLLEVYCSEDS